MNLAILENVWNKTPLVHNITNYVTVNDCANILLACGGSPIMADDKEEVEDITSICQALVINIGTLNKRTVAAMVLAGKRANELGIPVVLDPVGAGASTLRTAMTCLLMDEVKFSVIKGNISEIKAVFSGTGVTKGVDANVEDMVTEENLGATIAFAKEFSRSTGAVIAITGSIDIVTNEEKAYVIRNGHPMMAKITGSGCMTGAVLGAYCGANKGNYLEAVVCGVSAMGISGEIANERMEQMKPYAGTADYRIYLISAMSNLTKEIFENKSKIEER